MIETIITFLITNKAIIGVVVSIGEGIVVLINLWRKFRNTNEGKVDSMSDFPSAFRAFLRICNPINVFRKLR